jgi:hypothetical protein
MKPKQPSSRDSRAIQIKPKLAVRSGIRAGQNETHTDDPQDFVPLGGP